MQQEHPLYPDTIFFTENVERVLERAQELVEEQGCVGYRQQTTVDYSALFKDPDFGEKADSIYKTEDIPEHNFIMLEEKLKRLSWHRPPEIAPDVELIGFTKSVGIEKLSTMEEVAALTEAQLADGQRVYQGAVENKWFLNALSMVVVEPRMFKLVNCLTPAQFQQYSD